VGKYATFLTLATWKNDSSQPTPMSTQNNPQRRYHTICISTGCDNGFVHLSGCAVCDARSDAVESSALGLSDFDAKVPHHA
jgi:hypothetical protein